MQYNSNCLQKCLQVTSYSTEGASDDCRGVLVQDSITAAYDQPTQWQLWQVLTSVCNWQLLCHHLIHTTTTQCSNRHQSPQTHTAVTSNMMHYRNFMLGIDTGNLSALVLLDLLTTVDTVDHCIVLHQRERRLDLQHQLLLCFWMVLGSVRSYWVISIVNSAYIVLHTGTLLAVSCSQQTWSSLPPVHSHPHATLQLT